MEREFKETNDLTIQPVLTDDVPVNPPVASDVAKDVVIAILGAAVGLAGLLLVFIGFVYSRAEGFETRRGDRYRLVAKVGLAPFVISLGCAWCCLSWLTGDSASYWWSVFLFRAAIIFTGIYGAATLLFSDAITSIRALDLSNLI